jgi:hypothetical protein
VSSDDRRIEDWRHVMSADDLQIRQAHIDLTCTVQSVMLAACAIGC